MKRVYALYRVSTAKQVDHVACGNTIKDDIPIHNMEILFIQAIIIQKNGKKLKTEHILIK